MNRHKSRELYQKRFYNRAYFEGWYYKQVTADGQNTISFIPGVNFDKTGAKTFIQCLHLNQDNELKAYMIDYPIEDFLAIKDPFSVKVGTTKFSLKEINLDINTQDLKISGKINLINLTPIKTSILNPNIMGWFSYIPFMECNHGIVSMGHNLSGELIVNEEIINFTGGKGYIEKDWGRSFPSNYIWIQSNHFNDESISLFCSVATIPFLSFSFTGFICNLVYEEIEYRFATYNGSKLKVVERSENHVHLKFTNNKFSLEIKGDIADTKKLLAPKFGSMDKTIKEGLSGNVDILLKAKNGKIIISVKSNHCGMELVDTLLQK